MVSVPAKFMSAESVRQKPENRGNAADDTKLTLNLILRGWENMQNLTLPRNLKEMEKRQNVVGSLIQAQKRVICEIQSGFLVLISFPGKSQWQFPWDFLSRRHWMCPRCHHRNQAQCEENIIPSSTIANLQSYRHHHLHISPFRDKSLILRFRILVDLVPVNSIAFPSHTKSRIWNIPTDLFLGHLGLWKYSIFSYNLYQLASKEWN